MTNSLSEDIYALGELMATNLNTQGVVSADADDGLTSLAGKILEINASGTSLTIEVPLNLVYSDDFNITGTLTDGNNDAISGATIKLKVGNTVVDTDTTDNNGEVSFTQSPVSMGNHSFQLVFEGDSTHPPAISSVVTREIGKETSAITMSTPAASSSYYSDASISVSGTLKTDDNEAISGASILVKLGATTLTTLTTGNDGSFSGSVSAGDLSTGSNTLKFEFAGDSYYSATYQEVAVAVNAATLVLTSDKSVLSYADSDSCTLTATYTGSTVAGHTVKLYDASDDSLVATMVDNGDGTYSTTYASQGVGDIGFYAVSGNFVTETFSVLDAKFYADNTRINSLLDSNRRAFINYTVEKNDMVKFKFNTKPTHCLIGIGTSQSSCFVMEFNTNQTKLHKSTGTSTYNSNWVDSHSEIGVEIVAVSTSSDKANVYFEGTYADYWGVGQLGSNNNGLRVDKFTNDDFNIEIIVL